LNQRSILYLIIEFIKIDEKKKNNIIRDFIFENNKDIVVDLERFYNIICKCDSCLNLYREKNISFISSKRDFLDDWNNRELLEDKLNKQVNEDNEENREILGNIDNIEMNMLPEIREMPIEKVSLY